MARGVVETVAGFLDPFGTSWAQTLRLDGCGKDLGRALETSRGRSPGVPDTLEDVAARLTRPHVPKGVSSLVRLSTRAT